MKRKIEMKVSIVSNATPLIALVSLNQLNLLNMLFDKIYIPKQVYEEVVGSDENRIGSKELKKKIQEGELLRYDIRDYKFVEMMLGRLHRGELAVMVAAKELRINYVF
jgi:predicted nucleic acid-binding protein